MLVSAHNGGVDHHVFVVVIVGQEPENPLENAALGPSVEALIDDLPVAKALRQIAPRDAGANPEENGFNEQAIVPAVPPTWPSRPGRRSRMVVRTAYARPSRTRSPASALSISLRVSSNP